MKLSELIRAIDRYYPGDIEITDITDDSRSVTSGSLFICIRGRETDGHLYCGKAVQMGATAIVAEMGAELGDTYGVPTFFVPCTREARTALLCRYYGDLSGKIKIIGVTGTNGKTSVVSILDAIFRRAGYKTGTVGTLACRVGDRVIFSPSAGSHSYTTPDAATLYKILSKMEREGVEYLFMEVSSHALAEGRLAGLEFSCGIFTNLSVDHLDYHENMEEYFKAKSRLFDISRIKLFNIDDKYGDLLMRVYPQSYSYGKSEKAVFSAQRISLMGEKGINYLLHGRGGAFEIVSPLVGEFAVLNTLAAASAAFLCGIDPKYIASALLSLSYISGRMEKIEGPETRPTVFIDYAHTPDALRGVLNSARSFRGEGRGITVLFGCGGDRDRSKRAEMGRIATALADLTVITSDNSRNEPPEQIFRDIMKGIDREKPYTVIPDRRTAIRYAIENSSPGDIVLLCGKGHEKYEIDISGKHPFDEALLAREILNS